MFSNNGFSTLVDKTSKGTKRYFDSNLEKLKGGLLSFLVPHSCKIYVVAVFDRPYLWCVETIPKFIVN